MLSLCLTLTISTIWFKGKVEGAMTAPFLHQKLLPVTSFLPWFFTPPDPPPLPEHHKCQGAKSGSTPCEGPYASRACTSMWHRRSQQTSLWTSWKWDMNFADVKHSVLEANWIFHDANSVLAKSENWLLAWNVIFWQEIPWRRQRFDPGGQIQHSSGYMWPQDLSYVRYPISWEALRDMFSYNTIVRIDGVTTDI